MLEWVYRIVEEVQKEANRDPDYRELSQRRAALDGAFSDLLSRLSEDDRQMLLEYMDVVGDLQYRFSQLAWMYGRDHR